MSLSTYSSRKLRFSFDDTGMNNRSEIMWGLNYNYNTKIRKEDKIR